MVAIADSVTLEVLEAGVVEEVRRLTLRVSLTDAKGANKAVSAAAGVAALIVVVAVTLGCDVADAQWPVIVFEPPGVVISGCFGTPRVRYAVQNWLSLRTVWSSPEYVIRVDHEDPSGVRQLILRKSGELRGCIERARPLSGRHYQLKWSLGRDGVTRLAYLSAPIPDSLSECISSVIKGIPFSIGSAPVTISFENR